MEAIRSSVTSDKTGTTWCYTPEVDILHRQRVFEKRVLRRIF
jgi:hypothetical protein